MVLWFHTILDIIFLEGLVNYDLIENNIDLNKKKRDLH